MKRSAYALLFLSGFAVAPVVFAQTDAKTLIKEGRLGDAVSRLDEHLSDHPQDAAARFDRAQALIKLNRTNEAIKAYADLVRDFPQLPEPYNNLAVIYAQQGEFEKAREALNAALAVNPSYATAHENLGDLYAALAGASYNRALLIEPTNGSLRTKITLVSKIDRSPIQAPQVPPKAATAKKGATAANDPAPTALDPETSQAVAQAMLAWTTAWSAKDLPAYFAAYADAFKPEGGQSRAAWKTERSARIEAPARIQVEARDAEFESLGKDRVRVFFTQQYESDNVSDVNSKALELRRVKGEWKITREYNR